MLDPVGSTSWHNRHLTAFRRLDELLRAHGPAEPTVMIVGPGGVTVPASWLLNDAAAKAPRLRKFVGDAARYSDQVLRRIPGMPLRTLEPVELQSALTVPHRLIVVDRSQRVLAAVARQLSDVQCHCVDISFQQIPETADVISAFNVICRLDDPDEGLSSVLAALRPGGWLLIDDRSAAGRLDKYPDIRPVDSKIYRRDV